MYMEMEKKEDRGPNGNVGLKETVVQMAKVNGVIWCTGMC
mgnify:CR=1 FL=1